MRLRGASSTRRPARKPPMDQSSSSARSVSQAASGSPLGQSRVALIPHVSRATRSVSSGPPVRESARNIRRSTAQTGLMRRLRDSSWSRARFHSSTCSSVAYTRPCAHTVSGDARTRRDRSPSTPLFGEFARQARPFAEGRQGAIGSSSSSGAPKSQARPLCWAQTYVLASATSAFVGGMTCSIAAARQPRRVGGPVRYG